MFLTAWGKVPHCLEGHNYQSSCRNNLSAIKIKLIAKSVLQKRIHSRCCYWWFFCFIHLKKLYQFYTNHLLLQLPVKLRSTRAFQYKSYWLKFLNKIDGNTFNWILGHYFEHFINRKMNHDYVWFFPKTSRFMEHPQKSSSVTPTNSVLESAWRFWLSQKWKRNNQ